MHVDGTNVEVLVEEYDGKRLNSPNDVVSRSDGLLFFTDPPYGAPPDRPLDFQAVYVDGPRGNLRLLADDFEKPNGLAFSPDEKTLYVCDTGRYHLRAFDIQASGETLPESGQVIATMDPEEKGGPDGMKVDRDGRLYVAVAQGVWVFDPLGSLLGIIALPKRPSNLAWCGAEADRLAITAIDTVYRGPAQREWPDAGIHADAAARPTNRPDRTAATHDPRRGRPWDAPGFPSLGHADVQVAELPGSTVPGAPVIRSVPLAVLGKAMQSRMLVNPA